MKHIGVLLLLLSIGFASDDFLFIHESNAQIEVTAGDADIGADSILLKPNAIVNIVDRRFIPPHHGSINFFLRHHNHGNAIMGSSMAYCHCAMKLRMGFTVIEFGERWIKVQRLDSSYTVVETLQEETFELAKDNIPFLVTTKFDDSLTILIDENVVLKIPVPALDIHDLTLGSYMGLFTVSSLFIESYDSPVIINREQKYIEIPAMFKPEQFNSMAGLKNHHLITWGGGRASSAALFVTTTPDSLVYVGLKKIGAIPGDNLTPESWTKRSSKKYPDSDIIAKGTTLDITIIHKGQEYHVEDFLTDGNIRPYDFVFAGNLAFIPIWQSGCVVCLQSCPGSKVSNATYTMRDLENNKVQFQAHEKIVPGELVWLRFRIQLEEID